ncbi:citrate:proton symporter [Tissierella carlieri]|jgi:CitMHS family citrate-Mg2+:H+ or citrate-Ca2+:H+ symporter|uniref:Citrate:proton symporter n=1 Tax=Tissierella carlieri TaxID=689904 RepID=A0ABT1SDC8_9FIRM|nr:citrate:proton symporter [Tissierella carlieri]MBU5311732.1 citrate:proton symporter [Tissierella carlieri]MCQ4924486.1 citrate:proton symporter [Tissierella carlieri]MDU5080771.1 citrate:proton symporter [Bacillota bacterium]
MLALLGLLTIVVLLVLIMTKKASPVVALIVVPAVAAVIGGFGGELNTFITDGIKAIAPTGTMFIFAILFFGVLTDAGTFDPIIKKILKVVGSDPVKIAIGTAVLAMLVHLDGSGAVTFLVTIPAMLPVYDALGMQRSTLATIVALAAGTMNIVPWGGPTLRAASSLNVPVTELFNPMLVPVLVGLLFVIFISYRLGVKEKKRIGNVQLKDIETTTSVDEEKAKLARPHMFWINILTIIICVVVLIMGKLSPTVIFMFAFAFSLVINYPNIKDQRDRVDAHAKAALMMASILFAAGAFTGILKGAGMLTAMAEATVAIVPASIGKFLPIITGIFAMPASLLFDPDSFYFGVLPVLSEAASAFGVNSLNVGRAAILGQMTTGFPISPLTGATFLLIGLTGVDLGDHQKKTIPYAFATTIIMLIVALIIGVISI